jgi:hypothetical protein
MKTLSILFFAAILIFSCQQEIDNEVIDRERTYLLHRAGYVPTSGEVTFKELAPGKLEISINLSNTDANYDFPAHLHFGTINEVGELAVRLNDVEGATGTSVTILDQVKLSDGTLLNYDALQDLNGSVKIHMSENLFKHIVLAYGNVGANENYVTDGIAVCTGH